MFLLLSFKEFTIAEEISGSLKENLIFSQI